MASRRKHKEIYTEKAKEIVLGDRTKKNQFLIEAGDIERIISKVEMVNGEEMKIGKIRLYLQ